MIAIAIGIAIAIDGYLAEFSDSDSDSDSDCEGTVEHGDGNGDGHGQETGYTGFTEGGIVDRIVEFLFEVGMLKRTPRSGWQFLDNGSESVAEHVFRTTMIAYVLARLDGTVDTDKVLRMALAHDLPEARTGDLNYVNQKYVTADETRAAHDMTRGLPFGDELEDLMAEYRDESSPEAVVAHDADQLEILLELKEKLDSGCQAADDWTPFVLRRLRTDNAKTLAERILEGDSASWWFDKDSEWWVRGGKG